MYKLLLRYINKSKPDFFRNFEPMNDYYKLITLRQINYSPINKNIKYV